VNIYPRPTEPTLHVEREPVSGTCPECGAEELRAYPVLSENGWWNAVKCQRCLFSVSREPGGLLGSMTLLTDDIQGGSGDARR
jgi:hypothetical protein